jgi:hypothetical protein
MRFRLVTFLRSNGEKGGCKLKEEKRKKKEKERNAIDFKSIHR